MYTLSLAGSFGEAGNVSRYARELHGKMQQYLEKQNAYT